MNKFLFYGTITENNQLIIEGDDHRHCTKVLRKKTGDPIRSTDGLGREIKGLIHEVGKKATTVQIEEIVEHPLPTHRLHIAIAPTKNMSRTELFIEKAVEIGVQEISFIKTSNSERKTIKLERLEKIAISAMKQSFKFHAPILNDLTNFADFLKQTASDQEKYLLHYDPKAGHLAEAKWNQNNLLLVGPEGDFNPAEIQASIDHGFQVKIISNSRLRTETAGLVACTIFNVINR